MDNTYKNISYNSNSSSSQDSICIIGTHKSVINDLYIFCNHNNYNNFHYVVTNIKEHNEHIIPKNSYASPILAMNMSNISNLAYIVLCMDIPEYLHFENFSQIECESIFKTELFFFIDMLRHCAQLLSTAPHAPQSSLHSIRPYLLISIPKHVTHNTNRGMQKEHNYSSKYSSVQAAFATMLYSFLLEYQTHIRQNGIITETYEYESSLLPQHTERLYNTIKNIFENNTYDKSNTTHHLNRMGTLKKQITNLFKKKTSR